MFSKAFPCSQLAEKKSQSFEDYDENCYMYFLLSINSWFELVVCACLV